MIRGLLLCLGVAAALPARAFDAEALQARLAAVEQARASFTEVRRLAILDAPLTSRGTLTYRAPDYLEKVVETPPTARYVVDGERIAVEEQGVRREFELIRAPRLLALVDSFRATLAGDFDRLRDHYRLTLSGEVEAWRLQLVPLPASPLASHVEQVAITGSDTVIHRFEIAEHGGDTTRLELKPQ